MFVRSSRRRLLAGSLGIAGAVLTAPGIGRARPLTQGGPIAIEYWHRLSGDAATAVSELADAFNHEHEGRIQVTAVAQGDIAELTQKVRAAAAGGGLPGSLMADDADVPQYTASEVIVPFDPYLDDPELGLTPEERADFLPNQLDRHRRPLYDDRTMSYPNGFSTFTLYWNVDALRNAGFDGPPATWAEFPDHLRAIAAANPGMTGWNIQADLGSVLLLTLMTHGIDWIAEDGQSTNFDAPEATETLTWWRALADDGVLAPSDEHDALFAAGRSAYFLQSSVNARRFPSLISDFAWDAGMPPQGRADGQAVTEMFGPLNVLPATDEATQRAGWTWLRWLTTPAPHGRFIAAAGYNPSTRAAASSPALTDYYAQYPVAAKILRELAPRARIPTPGPGLTEIRGPIATNAATEVLLGRLSPEEGARKLKAEADEALQNAL